MTIHQQAIKNLAHPDYPLIESEHKRLEIFLHDLRDTCDQLDSSLSCHGCGSEKFASCKGRVPSFFLDLMDLIDKHFYHEETIMLRRHGDKTDEHFDNHCLAHTQIMQKLNVIIKDCYSIHKQGATADGYRQFFKKISSIFEAHSREYDAPFIQSTIT